MLSLVLVAQRNSKFQLANWFLTLSYGLDVLMIDIYSFLYNAKINLKFV